MTTDDINEDEIDLDIAVDICKQFVELNNGIVPYAVKILLEEIENS